MILHGKHTVLFAEKSLHGLVQDIDMGNGKTCSGQTVRLYRVAVILAGDLDPARAEILYRMSAAPMAELQLLGLCSAGEGA